LAEAEEANLLLKRIGGVPKPTSPNYAELAWGLWEKLTARPRPGRKRFDGYVSILDWFATRRTLPESIDLTCFDRAIAQRQKEHVVTDFLRWRMLNFEDGIKCLLEVVYHGMPLYRASSDGERMEWVSYADDDYIYLSKRGQYFDYIDIDSIPHWMSSYFFKPVHLDAYRQLFGHNYSDLSADNVLARRRALRQQIGAPMGNVVGIVNNSNSSLLNSLPDLMNRFYGERYQPGNSDTWARQVDVTAWLRKAGSMSRREAECLDVVSRSDEARRKGRR
jgi:hypothetical protein